jgi:hypothetical protein
VNERGKWQGMLTIARLNWPFYLAAAVVFVASLLGVFFAGALLLRCVCGLALAGSAYFLFGSLAVSHLIYDRSDLYRWQWVERALQGAGHGPIIFCHSGFDEASEALREKLGAAHWLVLDHFNEQQMSEPSIRRARALHPPTTETRPAAYNQWPVADDSTGIVFGLLAIHELRSEAERTAWFAEAARSLQKSGRIVLAEHTRDFANFLAFGPGFVHFHSPASWRRCWESAGLRALDEFRVTPWIRIFILIAK